MLGEGLEKAGKIEFGGVFQTTLRNRVSCTGIGLHSGEAVQMTLYPADADHGIVFLRSDLVGVEGRKRSDCLVPARFDAIGDTTLGSTVVNAQGVSVATVEHLMSAFAGLRIDNVLVELDAPEVPVFDGSAEPFLFLLECAGICELDAPRSYIRILQPITFEEDGKRVTLAPYDGFSVELEIEFDSAAIGRQSYEIDMETGSFKNEIARARTFGFLQDLEYMQSLGLARGGSLDNAVVLDKDIVLNSDGLRYKDEFVRHKILDAIGDLYLAGHAIIGKFHGVCSGHAMNNKLLRVLFANADKWELTNRTVTGMKFVAPGQLLEQGVAA
ncbi:MAG TPA: UDP-3-O-[3-hydroxymyristoyl] N-acetylglucosamine deacetylase [Alphaproteobacteria bacterium]|nr:UDP-3-O-[3-hydroxymyristoyl] N-acetylglucosamine deacetylase [Alphaproteobacteria bacterium]